MTSIRYGSQRDDGITIPAVPHDRPPRPALIPASMRAPVDYGWRRDLARRGELLVMMVASLATFIAGGVFGWMLNTLFRL